MVTVIAIPNLIFCIFPLIIKLQGTAYLTVDYISILMFFLLGCVFAAIGMLLSALTESQIIAYIGTFGIFLILYLWDGILSLFPNTAMSGLVFILHMENDEQFFDCGRSGLCRSGSSDSSVFSERDAL